MKKTLSTLLLLIPFFCIAQTKKPIEGFFGIKFGTDSAAVKAIALAKGGVVNQKSTEPGHMVFSNINYETWKNVNLYVEILENKAYKISIGIVEMGQSDILQDYKKLVDETNAAYGAGKETNGQSTSPLTVWTDNNHNISATILGGQIIILSYRDGDLAPIGRRNP